MLCFVLVSCGSRQKDADSFVVALETHTGNDYEIAKLYTKVGEYVVLLNNATGEYEAYNLEKWDRKEHTTYADFTSNNVVSGVDIVLNLEQTSEWIESGYTQDVYETVYEYYEYWDDYCECWVEDYDVYDVWVDSYWVDTSGYRTFYYGGGFRFSNRIKGSKDLELLVSLEEDVKKGIISYTLRNDFKLSKERSSELADMVTKYQKLESIRSLTTSEKNKFSLDALGVSYSEIESALRDKGNGSDASYKKLIDQAAKTNDTSAENIGSFMNEYVEEGIL